MTASHERRVAVTGLGFITPIGSAPSAVWSSVVSGQTGIDRVRRFDPAPFRSQLDAEVSDFDFTPYSHRRRATRLDRFSQFAVGAAHNALVDARVPVPTESSKFQLNGRSPGGGEPALHDASVYLGSALGGVAFGEEQHGKYIEDGIRSVSPYLALSIFSGAACTNVAMAFNIRGPAVSNANSCASGAVAIGEAFRAIRNGRTDMALAGGVECPLAPLTFGSFSVIKAMSKHNEHPREACRPFDRDRDGFVMGEGAAVLVLEEWESALRRRARIRAEILGYASTSDAHDMTVPRPDGIEAARAARQALHDAGMSSSEIDLINAHATGTVLGDAAEMAAIRQVFGEDMPPIGATKSLHGHALGATSAIEVGITCMALERGFVTGIRNLERTDPSCEGNHVLPPGRHGDYRIALTNAFGFGGINACLVIGKGDGD